MCYYDQLATYQRQGFDIIVDKTWEDISIRDCFDDTCYDIREMEDKVNSGQLDWFMLRVRVMLDGLELGSSCIGGMLYEDAREVLTDGMAEDAISEAIEQARQQVYPLMRKLQAINEEMERELA